MDKRVETFMSGEQVPRSGVYRVGHRKHSIRDIKLLKDGRFPPCPKCLSAVRFTLVIAILAESAKERFRFLMQPKAGLAGEA
jgi:hypothetical protein